MARLGGLLLVLLLVACSSMSENRGTDLQSVVKAFHHDVRWRYNRNAAASVDGQYSNQFLDMLDEMKEDLNISDWEIRRVELSPDGTEAKIRVRIKYYKMPSTVVKEEMLDQVWQKKQERWVLVSQTGGPFVFPPEEEPGAEPAPAPDENEDGSQP
jgi:hypothetical protein